jgi:monooxygenase
MSRNGCGEFIEVLIVGAGLSGIGAAVHLQRDCAAKSIAVLEARESIGGTWDLFRYPGIRSDSDMYTFGYRFRPWTQPKSFADGQSILEYINATADQFGVRRLIRFQRRVMTAHWDSTQAQWTVCVEHVDTGTRSTIRCAFLYFCTGYYRYDEGFTPDLPGLERFTGQVIHPQHWPANLDYADKRVVVIGSGATAITLLPNLADSARHITMLQRSPSYVSARPGKDPLAEQLRRHLPEKLAYAAVRWKNALLGIAIFQLSRRRPDFMRKVIRSAAVKQLPPDYAVDVHFNPRYNPWDQRMCLAPDGDLFAALRSGRASVVTDRIATFTTKGIELESGAHLEADIVVTATGLNLIALGGVQLDINGAAVDLSATLLYKGAMLSGVPNLAWTIGYTNASWTLKADLIAEYICRLLNYMDAYGYTTVEPDAAGVVGQVPAIDLASGYVTRSVADLPKQGGQAPWRLHQNYVRDVRMLRRGPVDDGVVFGAPHPRRSPQPSAAHARSS